MADPAPDSLVERLRRAIEPRGEVREAYLFGSQARPAPAAHSDVDVAVWVEPAALNAGGFGYAAELTADLQRALSRSDVDVVILNAAPPLLYHRVLRDGIRVVARDLRETTTREGRALSRYCDYVPQLAKIAAAAEARTAPA